MDVRRTILAIAALTVVASVVGIARVDFTLAQSTAQHRNHREDPGKGFQLIFKAPIDECFAGVGNPYPPLIDGECTQGQPKRNGAQIWGMAESSEFLYWGDGSQCPLHRAGCSRSNSDSDPRSGARMGVRVCGGDSCPREPQVAKSW